MKSNFYRWLESMGQEPETWLRDLTLYYAKYISIACITLAPLIFVLSLLTPVPPPPGAAKNTDFPPEGFVPMIFVSLYFFVVVVLTISYMGGWWRLATKFAAPRNFDGAQIYKRQRGSVGGVRYGRILNIGVSESGLYLRCLFPFNFIQRPLLIPWKEIKAINEVRFLWQKSPFIIVGSPKLCSIVLKNKKLASAVREMWERQH